MNRRATRRALLAGFPSLMTVALSSAAVASSIAGPTTGGEDPIFAAIARHKESCERWNAAVEAHRAVADTLWQEAEFIAQERTEERAAFVAANPEYAELASFERQDDAVFCEFRHNAARQLERDNMECQRARMQMKEAAEAEYEAVMALAAIRPATKQGWVALEQHVKGEGVSRAACYDERRQSAALLRSFELSVQSALRA
jgi:hypothetical protein